MQKLYNMMGQIGLSNNVGTGETLTEKMQSQDLDGAVDNGNASAEEQKADELQNDGDEDEEVKRAEPAGSPEQENNDEAENIRKTENKIELEDFHIVDESSEKQ